MSSLRGRWILAIIAVRRDEVPGGGHSFCVLSWTLFAHLWTSTQARPVHLWLLVILVTGGLSADECVKCLKARWDFTHRLPYEATLLPPAFRVTPCVPVDQFFREAQKLKDSVDRDRVVSSRQEP